MSPSVPNTIVTFTPNPALDVTSGVPHLEEGVKMRCERALREPGGGGINAARVVVELGGHATAVHTAGGPVGEMLTAMVADAGVDNIAIPVAGHTRESFTVHERETDRLYRFVLPGPELSEHEWRRCLAVVSGLLVPGTVLLASGSLPPGMPVDMVARLSRAAREAGARLLVDVSGPPMHAALAEGVFLARFNRPEFEEYVGRPMADVDERADEAARLVAAGAARVVVATLGGDGALIISRGGRLDLRPPQVTAASPVGAGDSMLGAICLGLAHGWDVETACALGVVAAAAAHLTPGTGLCRRADVARMFEEMTGRPAPAPVGAP